MPLTLGIPGIIRVITSPDGTRETVNFRNVGNQGTVYGSRSQEVKVKFLLFTASQSYSCGGLLITDIT